MKQKLLLFAFTLLSTMLFSQAQNTAFEDARTTGGSQNMFLKTVTKTDGYGNIYTAGSTINGYGDYDIFITKVNSSGVQLWQKQIPGVSGGMDFAAGMAVTDTYIILTGGISTTTANPTTDIFTMKLAASTGSVNWTSYYNAAGNAYDAARHVAIDGSGNIYVAGGGYNASFNTDYITLKYNSSGTQQWVKVWDYLGYDDCAIKVATSGSNLTITGAVTTATASVYKLATLTLAQSTGSLLATNVSTAITTSSVDIVSDLTTDGSGNIIVVGNNFVSGQGNNFYIQKLSGTTLLSAWTYTWNGASSLDDAAKAVQCDASGNMFVAGYSTSSTLGKELTVLKLNSSGVLQNSTTSGFSSDDEAADLVLDASGNAYVTGYKTDALNNKDYYTAKYSSSLSKIWEIQSDGHHLNDQATNITLDSLNNVIVAGQSEITSSSLEYTTIKYVQNEVITPTDFNGESVNSNQHYYRNSGQLVNTSGAAIPEIKYYTQYTNPKCYFKDNSSSFVFAKIDTVVSTIDTLQRIDLIHTNSSESTKIYPLEEQTSFYLNYHLANTPTEGITRVCGNQRLITPNLYPNIDLMYSSNQNGIKYYYIVKPGADMRNIKIEFSGATSYSLNGTTNALSINSKYGSITFDRPTAYQLTSANATVAVTSFSPSWVVDGASNKYKFQDGTYTSSLTLVIQVDQGNGTQSITNTLDNVKWTTYQGSNAGDYFRDGAYSADDFYYTTGYTFSANFPGSTGSTPVLTYSDIFVEKFDMNGLKKWVTQFGGSSFDFGQGIAIDNNNQPIVVGYGNSGDMPRPNPFGSTAALIGSYDGIIMRLISNTGVVEWARFMGGTYYEEFNKVAVNSANDIYVVGQTESANYPYVSSNGFNQTCTSNTAGKNGIITKFTNYLPVASTCVGPNTTSDWMTNIYIDKTTNDVYAVGVGSYITATNPGNNAFIQSGNQGGYDGFILKYNSSNTKLWSTNFGGSSDDYINTIQMNKQGHLYIAGRTGSANIKHKFYNSGVGYNDTVKTTSGQVPFIARFDTKDSLIWNTYYEVSGKLYEIHDLAIDTTSTIFVTGTGSGSGNCSFPYPVGGSVYYDTIQGGAQDAFIASFNKYGVNAWGTYFSGDGSDQLNAITYGKDATLYFCGSTQSNTGTYPLADNNGLGSIQWNFKGVADATAGLFQVTSNMVGIKEYAFSNNLSALVYPNPASNELNVILQDNSLSLNYEIINIHGQIVANGILQNNKISLPNLAQGMYIITLKSKEASYSQKFIKN